MSDELSADVLANSRRLPKKPDSIILKGPKVTLLPSVLETDSEKLFAASNGSPFRAGRYAAEAYDANEAIWKFLFDGPFDNIDDFRSGMQDWIEAPTGLCFTVLENESGIPVGVTNYMNNHPEHLRIEIGGIWFTPAVQRTGINTEAAYLLLRRAFDLGYRRVEWKCHSEHIRSRSAALKIGYVFEGIQEAHMIWKGRSRNTAWFRILDSEWPDVRLALEQRFDL
jgi:RimJ/RimL family protein N-acetyltransferase